MPTRKGEKQDKTVQFKVVQQSYEDKDYEGAPKPVLVETKDFRKKRSRREDEAVASFFDDPTPDDFSDKRNMLMEDDTIKGVHDETLFDDEVEEEFDNDFLHEIIAGDAGDYEEEEEEFDEVEEYPKHDTSKRAIDRQFARMMREFNADEGINDPDCEDPRLQGAVDVQQYSKALEEFMEDNSGMTFGGDHGPMKNKGLLNQLKQMTHKNAIFDSAKEGYFVTVLGDKKAREKSDFIREEAELRRITGDMLRKKREKEEAEMIEREEKGLPPMEESEDEMTEEVQVMSIPKKDRMDCETVLSTYSTLYNHPNVIAAEKKKLDPAKIAKRRAEAQERQQRRLAEEEGNEECDLDELGIDLSDRPKDETKEEKKLRRQLVKQLQRERRSEKKSVKSAYKYAALDRGVVAPLAKQMKSQKSLSLVHGEKL